MSLKCPEGGRENVSALAESCSDYGYKIRSHYVGINYYDKMAAKVKRKQVEQSQKSTKLVYLYAGVFAVFIIAMIFLTGIESRNPKNLLMELANQSFDTDFDTFKAALQGQGIDMDATYEFKDISYEKNKKGLLIIDCLVTYTSSNIDQYRDIKYNSQEARELCMIMKNIDAIIKEHLTYTYTSKNGIVRISLNGSDRDNGTIILDKNNCKYRYSDVVDLDKLTDGKFEMVDELEINGKEVFKESDGGY